MAVTKDRLHLKDSFWHARITSLVRDGLPHQYEQLVETGRVQNFERAARHERGTFQGLRFNDSDVYKWLEAVAECLKHVSDSRLVETARSVIQIVEAAQESDGYLFTYQQTAPVDAPHSRRWSCLNSDHEMYCMGHLIEAAVAWAELGEDRLLGVGQKAADCISHFCAKHERCPICGHPEIEIALIRLSTHLGDNRYAELAERMIRTRGTRPSLFEEEIARQDRPDVRYAESMFLRHGKYSGDYAQDHLPITEQSSIEGHAVRAAYLFTAAAMLDKPDLLAATERLWLNTIEKRMYVTGGIGPSGRNEGFTTDFDLPNDTAYAETCAGIALALWGSAMTNATGDASYFETVELATYNGILSGISADSKAYFYVNPLEANGTHNHEPWFHCACCPPNIARYIATFPSRAIQVSVQGLTINSPIACESQFWQLIADFPHHGVWTLHYRGSLAQRQLVKVRLPDWADNATIELPEGSEPAEFESGYILIDRVWQPGESMKADFPMPWQWLEASPNVAANLGRVALRRGPTIYAAVSSIHETSPSWHTVDPEQEIVVSYDRVSIETTALSQSFPSELYVPFGTLESEASQLDMVPYRDWAHKRDRRMQVWLRT